MLTMCVQRNDKTALNADKMLTQVRPNYSMPRNYRLTTGEYSVPLAETESTDIPLLFSHRRSVNHGWKSQWQP